MSNLNLNRERGAGECGQLLATRNADVSPFLPRADAQLDATPSPAAAGADVQQNVSPAPAHADDESRVSSDQVAATPSPADAGEESVHSPSDAAEESEVTSAQLDVTPSPAAACDDVHDTLTPAPRHADIKTSGGDPCTPANQIMRQYTPRKNLVRSDSMSSAMREMFYNTESDETGATPVENDNVQSQTSTKAVVDSPGSPELMSQESAITALDDQSQDTSEDMRTSDPPHTDDSPDADVSTSPVNSQDTHVSSTPGASQDSLVSGSVGASQDTIVTPEASSSSSQAKEVVDVSSSRSVEHDEHVAKVLEDCGKRLLCRPYTRHPRLWYHGLRAHPSLCRYLGIDDGVRLAATGIVWATDSHHCFEIVLCASLGWQDVGTSRFKKHRKSHKIRPTGCMYAYLRTAKHVGTLLGSKSLEKQKAWNFTSS